MTEFWKDVLIVIGKNLHLLAFAVVPVLFFVFGKKLFPFTRLRLREILAVVLASVLAVTKDVVPPTINVQELDPQIDTRFNLTLDKAQHRIVNYAMSNTFGFGGQNSTIIIKKAE